MNDDRRSIAMDNSNSNSNNSNPTSWWRFLLPLVIQTGLIFSIPIQPLYTQIVGKTVVLQTVPVDPYDILRGYSQTLAYDISNPNNLAKISGWKEIVNAKKKDILPTATYDKPILPRGTKIYIILEAPKDTQTQPPQVWKAVAVTDKLPESLPTNRIALQGTYKQFWGTGTIEYGLETYYLPEENIDRINKDINTARSNKPQAVILEAKIDPSGKAVPISFWIDKDNYRY
jgi:uncharacterized membrane-anchored protein